MLGTRYRAELPHAARQNLGVCIGLTVMAAVCMKRAIIHRGTEYCDNPGTLNSASDVSYE